jgi:hypothetical protein
MVGAHTHHAEALVHDGLLVHEEGGGRGRGGDGEKLELHRTTAVCVIVM